MSFAPPGSERAWSGVYCADVCGSLCARDYKDVGNEYVDENKLIIEVIA